MINRSTASPILRIYYEPNPMAALRSMFFYHKCWWSPFPHSHSPPPVWAAPASAGLHPEPWRHKTQDTRQDQLATVISCCRTSFQPHWDSSKTQTRSGWHMQRTHTHTHMHGCSKVWSGTVAAPVFEVEVLAQMKVFEWRVSGEGRQDSEQVCIETCQHTHCRISVFVGTS